jgi:hypothetical protein
VNRGAVTLTEPHGRGLNPAVKRVNECLVLYASPHNGDRDLCRRSHLLLFDLHYPHKMESSMVWLLLLLVPLAVLVILFFRLRKTIQAEKEVIAKLRAENDALAQFRNILDAKAEAERILAEARSRSDEVTRAATAALAEAQQNAARLKQQSEQSSTEELAQARLEAKALRSRAQTALSDAQDKVESILRSAQQEAQKLIEKATKRGEEIAGKAFEAVENAEHYQQIADAM